MIIRIRQILVSKWFLLGLGIKIVFLFFFVADIPRQLFLPFFDSTVTHFGVNPWSLNPEGSFAYGGFLFLVMYLPKLLLYSIFGDLALGTQALSLVALKLPLLLFDTLLFVVLCQLVIDRRRSLIFLYWLNPVLFYINYIHAQLDVVSMALCFLSLKLFLDKSIGKSAIVFGLATASKFHVVAAIPLILVYLWHKEFRQTALLQMGKWLSIWLVTTLVFFIPLIGSGVFGSASVSSPELARLLAAQLPLGGDQIFYLGLLGTLLVIGRLIIATYISEVGFVLGVGVIFSSLVFFANSTAGWYYWCVPFLALFFAIFLNAPRILFWVFSLFYLVNFTFLDFIASRYGLQEGSSYPLIAGVLLTTVHAGLLAILIMEWQVVLKSEVRIFNRLRPLKIGVAGDSGSGKDTLTWSLQNVFGQDRLAVIEGDNYHKWERGDENWEKYTHLNPKANHMFSLFSHAASLSRGRAVYYNAYSHDSGRFLPLQELKPSRTLVIQGLHTFYLKRMRDEFDLKIFLDPHPLVRMAWKIHRDCNQRGYAREKVLRQLDSRTSDSAKYIASQKEFADLIVAIFPEHELTAEQAEQAKQGVLPPLKAQYTVWNDIDLTPLIGALEKMGVSVNVDFPENDISRARVSVVESAALGRLADLAALVFPTPRRITRGAKPPVWQSGFSGLTQIFVMFILQNQLERA